MQRVRVAGGVLAADQWRALGKIAANFAHETPLHLTTRQDIELHNLTAGKVPPAQEALAAVGLTGLGAGGDSLRNITVCPCSGILSNSVGLHPLARLIYDNLQGDEGILALPRKFKISLSCCLGCGQPWINDLGFVVRRQDSQYGFQLIGAGSLGRAPATGIVLFDWLPPEDVVLNSELVSQRAVERSEVQVGEFTEPVFRAYWEIDRPDDLETKLFAAWRPEELKSRLWMLGGGMGLLTLLFGSLACYFRIDDATHGKYRNKLRVGTGALWAVIAAGSAFLLVA